MRAIQAQFQWVVFAGTTVLLSVFGLVRVQRFALNGYDLGIFDQIVRRYASFQAPYVTLKGDEFNIFGDHFHPIVAAWAPLYWIWDDPRMLIIGQALVVAAAVFPLWRFVRRHWGGPIAKVFVVAAMTAWPMAALAGFDVHEIAFAIPLLAWVIDGLDRRRAWQIIVASVLLLLVREDMGAVVAAIGVVWLIQHRRQWALGAGLIAGGLAVFAVVTGVIIPHFGTSGYQYWDYGAILRAPWLGLVDLFWPPIKILTWLALLVPLGLLPLRSPYALIALPIMVERMLAARESLWGVGFHYNAPVWIVLVFAAVDAYGRLPARWRARLRVRRVVVAVAALVVNLGLLVGVFVSSALGTENTADRRAGAAQIPANTCVVASNRLADAFVRTNRVTVPGVSIYPQDFYILDMSLGVTSVSPVGLTAQQVYDDAIAQGFAPVFQQGSVVVLRSAGYTGPDPVACGPGTR